jgi:hypothetical protein
MSPIIVYARNGTNERTMVFMGGDKYHSPTPIIFFDVA